MVAWSCNDCHKNPELLRMRGFCGEEPFSEDYRSAQKDSQGRMYVDGGDIMSSCRGDARTDRYYRCPIGEAMSAQSFVKTVFDYYRRTNQGEDVGALFSMDSTNVLFEAVETAKSVVSEIRSLELEIARKRKH